MGFELDSKRGVFNHYGVRTTDQKFGGNVDDEVIKFAVWTFDYDDLPTYGTSNLQMVIPANARILSAKLEIITGFTSTSTTTDLLVGLYTSAGVAIDADGLITAAQATQTTIATAGNVIDGASGTPGALINVTIGATAGELVVAGSAADLTAGRARLIVEYIKAGI
jgi:hypothetical protein